MDRTDADREPVSKTKKEAETVCIGSHRDDPLGQIATLGLKVPESTTKDEWVKYLKARGFKIVPCPKENG